MFPMAWEEMDPFLPFPSSSSLLSSLWVTHSLLCKAAGCCRFLHFTCN
jgi:hypothetical protein